MAQITVNVLKTEQKQTTINGINYRYIRCFLDIDFTETSATTLLFNTLDIKNSVLSGYDTLTTGYLRNSPLNSSASTINDSATYRGPYFSGNNIIGDGFSGGSASGQYRVCYIYMVTDTAGVNLLMFSNEGGAYLDSIGASYSSPAQDSFGYIEVTLSGNSGGNFPSVDQSNKDVADWWLENSTDVNPPSTDPYEPGGTSGSGGGDGSFDLQNDSIDFPSLPTLSAVDTGLVSIYTPSLSQLKALATFLWNANPTDVDWWKKLVANPLDLILGLSIVPVHVPQGTQQTIKVGLIDTGVSVTKAASQFVTVDCGSVTIQKNCGGSALDFSPFTKFSLYLPFIGTRTISCDDIMGRTVHVKYNVDLLSGGCTAMVKITGGPEDNPLDAILYQYSGACAISIPLTGETFTNMITSTIQLAASIGATVATGGAAAGVTAASAANSLMSMKPIIERAGGVSGAAGQLGIMRPYLIAEVPRQSVPANCNQFTGYPSNMKATIGDLTGYTEVDIIYLKGIEATQAELDELETILKGGFII